MARDKIFALLPALFNPVPSMVIAPSLIDRFVKAPEPSIVGVPVVKVDVGVFKNPHPRQVIPFGFATNWLISE